MAQWLMDNWYNIVFVIVAIGVVVYGITAGKVKEWLKYAVVIAEQELGKETGQLKLRYVYSMFVEKYPAIASVLPFAVFSKWVDLALDWMRQQLEQNKAIRVFIEGEQDNQIGFAAGEES